MIKESQNIIHQPIKHPLFLNKQFSTVKNDSIPKDTSGFAGIKNLAQSFDSQDKSYISSDLLFRESQIQNKTDISEFRNMNHVSFPVEQRNNPDMTQNSYQIMETFRNLGQFAENDYQFHSREQRVKPLDLEKLSIK